MQLESKTTSVEGKVACSGDSRTELQSEPLIFDLPHGVHPDRLNQ